MYQVRRFRYGETQLNGKAAKLMEASHDAILKLNRVLNLHTCHRWTTREVILLLESFGAFHAAYPDDFRLNEYQVDQMKIAINLAASACFEKMDDAKQANEAIAELETQTKEFNKMREIVGGLGANEMSFIAGACLCFLKLFS